MRGALTRGERLLRATVFAFVGVGLALLAHWVGSRMLPGWTTIAAVAALMGGLGWWVGTRSRGAACLIVLTVASQIALHATFAWTMGGRGAALLLCGAPHGATAHTASVLFEAQVGHGHVTSWSASSLPMLGAHAAAAALLGVWLRFGERALDEAVEVLAVVYGSLTALLSLISPLAARPTNPRLAIRADRRSPRLRSRTVGAVGLRGPPVAVPFGG